MKLPFYATIFTILGVMILCALGLWQVKRLHWKVDILSDVDRAFEEVARGDISDFDLHEDILRDDFMIAGRLRGAYLHDLSVLIQSRVYDRVPGYHVITPFRVSGYDDQVVLVNRGWIPLEQERSDDFSMSEPVGDVEIAGMLVFSPPARYQPDNDLKRGIWYRIDIERFRDVMNIPHLSSKILYVGMEEGASDDEFPIPAMESLKSNIRNNHAQYAFFWFAMAIAMVGVYGVRFIVPQAKRG